MSHDIYVRKPEVGKNSEFKFNGREKALNCCGFPHFLDIPFVFSDGKNTQNKVIYKSISSGNTALLN
jgi:hypothetical protein